MCITYLAYLGAAVGRRKSREDLLPLAAASYMHDTNNKVAKSHSYNRQPHTDRWAISQSGNHGTEVLLGRYVMAGQYNGRQSNTYI